MKRLKKWIAIALGAMTLLCTCACAPQGETDGPVSDVGNGEYVAPEVENAVEDGDILSMPKTFSFTSTSLVKSMSETTNEKSTISVTLEATVEPVDAYNKEVDWAVVWADDATLISQAVENYVTVEPLTDGSTTATVTCYRPFVDNTVIITVTTREGGFTSTCDVEFVGVPTSMQVIPVGDYAREVSRRDGEFFGYDETIYHYYMSTGTTYQFEVILDNPLHQVSDSFYDGIYLRLYNDSANQYVVCTATRYDGVVEEGISCPEFTMGNLACATFGGYYADTTNFYSQELEDGLFSLKPLYTYKKTIAHGNPGLFYWNGVSYIKAQPTAYCDGYFYQDYFFEVSSMKFDMVHYFGTQIVEGVTGVSLDNTNVQV